MHLCIKCNHNTCDLNTHSGVQLLLYYIYAFSRSVCLMFDIDSVINKKMINALAGKVYLEYHFRLFQMMITLRRDSPLFIQEDMSMHSALSFHKRECQSDITQT